jgi:hypothetical protein
MGSSEIMVGFGYSQRLLRVGTAAYRIVFSTLNPASG